VFEFLFDTPLLIAGPVIVGSLCLFGIVGLVVVRRRVLPKLRIHDSDSGFCGAMQQAVMVFYGLVVALIFGERLAALFRPGNSHLARKRPPWLCFIATRVAILNHPAANSRNNFVNTSFKSSIKPGRCSNAERLRVPT